MSNLHYVEFPLESGGSIIVEVSDNEQSGSWRDSSETLLTRASDTLENAIDRVKPAAQAILSRLTTLSERPSEIEVEFGIKLSAQAGAIIASGSVDANYVIKIKWTNPGKQADEIE